MNRSRARALNTPAAIAQDTFRRQINWQENATAPAVRPYGSERLGDLLIEKLMYESEPGILVPAVIVSQPASNGAARPAVLLTSARGKRAAWSEIQALASRGAVVLAIDVRGIGETRPIGATKGDSWQDWFSDYDSAMTSVMLGRSLVVQRAQDIQRAFYLLAARPGIDPQRIYGAAQGSAAPALLHAAGSGVPFARLLLDQMLASYRSVAEAPIHRGIFESIVPGALRSYDLPGLAAMLAPKPVIIVDATSPIGEPLAPSAARAEFNAVSNARILTRLIEEPSATVYPRLLD